MRTLGLTLGKYAPLHRGHQHVIEAALEETDRVVVVIYDSPETISIPLPVRSGWIRRLFPKVEVVEARDGPAEVGDTPEIEARHEAYLLALLRERQIEVTHFFSSERYGDHVSRALGAVDRRVDPERSRFPVSSSDVRRDPRACRHLVPPCVYRDLITNVVLLGAPSTGKTTLAEALAAKHGTRWMPEYGREVWEEHHVDRRLRKEQLVAIAEGHLEREEALLLECDRYLFTDTNVLTTLQFALDYHGVGAQRLVDLAREAESRYDLWFLCEADIPYADTWDRSGPVHREEMQGRIVADLVERGIDFTRLRGSVEERIGRVEEVLAGFDKLGPVRA